MVTGVGRVEKTRKSVSLKSSSPESSSSSFYPSSLSTYGSFSSASSQYQPRDHLETLFIKHGYPTPVSLSSLRDLTATVSAYNPPSPRRSRSDSPEHLDSSSPTKPIPIPRRQGPIYDEHLPVTPLTGRFDKEDYIEDWERASLSAKSRHAFPRVHYHSSMRSDHSPYYSPVASPTMSPRRTASPQPSRSRSQAPTKSVPGFHLGALPRFHPAVFQDPTSSHSITGQPASPRQSRQQTYRPSSSSRDMKWQFGYRDLDLNQSPSAPRLDPLNSPGPVTPLALESGDYLAAGSVSKPSNSRDAKTQHSGPHPDLIEKLLVCKNENDRQRRISTKGR
ncbi:hypothetical protein N7495_007817 [Penicillium taxi]|uniref:uncharacterized protein n=1 Tax=Penicillium taxi TaxID=168475 RepID=UPI002544F5AB|nr:uncharacterized protein N7495_007817 [Penicillium taxi]KAJ5887776.1 hypothetical protein N7495_007817 [Penicillium taxi]